MNAKKEAASPLLTYLQTMPSGLGACRAMLRGRSSGLKGRYAIACADPAFGRSLDPGDLCGPCGQVYGAGGGLPPQRRGTLIATYFQDQKIEDYMIEVSTVPGDCHE